MRSSFDASLNQISSKWNNIAPTNQKIQALEDILHPPVLEPKLNSYEDTKKIKLRWSIDNMYTRLISPNRRERFLHSTTPIAPDCFIPNSVVRDRLREIIPLIPTFTKEWKLRKISFLAESNEEREKSLDSESSSQQFFLTSDLDSFATLKSKLLDVTEVLSKPASIESFLSALLTPDTKEARLQFFDLLVAQRLLAQRKLKRYKGKLLNSDDVEEEKIQSAEFHAMLANIKPDVEAVLSSHLSALSRALLKDIASLCSDAADHSKSHGDTNHLVSKHGIPEPLISKYHSTDSSKTKPASLVKGSFATTNASSKQNISFKVALESDSSRNEFIKSEDLSSSILQVSKIIVVNDILCNLKSS